MHDIKTFLESINYENIEEELLSLNIEKVVLNKKNETFNVYLNGDKVLPFTLTKKLVDNSYLINNLYKTNINISFNNITNDDLMLYLKEIINNLVIEKPSLVSLSDRLPEIDDDIIIFEVISEAEAETIKNEESLS